MKGTTGLRGIRNIGISVIGAMSAMAGVQGRVLWDAIAKFNTPVVAHSRGKKRNQRMGHEFRGLRETKRSARFYMEPRFPNGTLRSAPIICRKAGV
jgi:hypothetical protein